MQDLWHGTYSYQVRCMEQASTRDSLPQRLLWKTTCYRCWFEQAASATRSVQQAKSVTNCVGNWLNYDSEKSYDWEAARVGLQDIRTKLSTWDVCPEQYYIRGQGDVMRKSLSKIPEWARFAFVTGSSSCLDATTTQLYDVVIILNGSEQTTCKRRLRKHILQKPQEVTEYLAKIKIIIM